MDKDIQAEKLNLLYDFANYLPPDPLYMFTLGLLVGVTDRVHFVRELSGAPIALRLLSTKARLWPGPGFHATVNEVSVPDPMTFASVIAKNEDPICVELVCPGLFETNEFYQELLVDNYAFIRSGQDASTQYTDKRINELRTEINQALDVYNECVRQSAERAEHRQEEVKTFMKMAKKQLAQCSKEMKRLEEEVSQD